MFVTRLNTWLVRLENALAISLLGFVILATVIQVFWRAVLADPLSWTEEAVRLAFVWVIYVGVIRAVRRRTHISVDFFVRPNSIESLGSAEVLPVGHDDDVL